MSNRLDQVREEEETPKRARYARGKLEELGIDIDYDDGLEIRFKFKGNTIKLWPYSGWFSGKGLKDGRGIEKLLGQMK